MKNFYVIPILSLLLVTQSCKLADVRTSTIDETELDREEKAIRLLDKVVTKYNLEKLASAETYSFKGSDKWHGLNSLVNPFPENGELMEFRFRTNSFDGQCNYLEVNDPTIRGVQSFNYYEIKEGAEATFKKKKSRIFMIPAIQYFFELPLRLKSAPILKYAGTLEFEGKMYDLVLATWQKTAPHKEHDQYLLHISQETGHLNFVGYTVRDIYLPSPPNVYGTVRFVDFKTSSDGITYPGTWNFEANGLRERDKFTHTITIDDLELNSFDVSELYPDADMKYLGDAKTER